jgi:hypothetical protein
VHFRDFQFLTQVAHTRDSERSRANLRRDGLEPNDYAIIIVGALCTKTVMGRSILLTRTSDGSVKAFGRNEPGLQHRHATRDQALDARDTATTHTTGRKPCT